MASKDPKQFNTPFDSQSQVDVGGGYSGRSTERRKALTKARTLDDVLEAFRNFAGSEAEKGHLFERLIRQFLKSDPVYSQQFNQVWLWNEWPERPRGMPDIGVDLVAERTEGGTCAIQCKFYELKSRVDHKSVGTFIATADLIGAEQRIFISTTDNIASNSRRLLEDPNKPTTLLGMSELRSRKIDWPDIARPEELRIHTPKFSLRPDQQRALDDVIDGFDEYDRGKLILPCGVGKTFTALKIAENLVGNGGSVLYLVPSIALLAQAMRQWSEQSNPQIPHRYIGVCSDIKAGRNSEDASISELEIPVTTDANSIASALANPNHHKMTVVFSTYQSLERIEEAQSQGLIRDAAPDFDLVVCDEAHRTTGVESANGDGSHFTLVHNAQRIRAKKRLYMTATPRIYSEAAKSKARAIGQVALYSMDDEAQYGPEFHRMTFAEAVEQNRLSDYKVVILNIDQSAIAGPLAAANTAGASRELSLDDASKLVGCTSALFNPDRENNASPLLRAIAFTNTIKNSRIVSENWPTVANEAQKVMSDKAQHRQINCSVQHVDGKMNALIRNRKLEWLRESEEDEYEVRILSNARCLSEGVDVPALDAVLFLQPRRSQVDVVQAVGRVMRKAQGKKFGYIILPIVIPPDADPVKALDSNERYRVVWEVLQALRSHDECLDAEINQLDLNRNAGGRINMIGIGGKGDARDTITDEAARVMQYQLPGLTIDAFRAKIVEKVGDRQYWDRWGKDIARIASTLEIRIKECIPAHGTVNGTDRTKIRLKFDELLQSMRATTNDALSESGAISIIAQHMITEPVFQALFRDYDFANSNPVARSLNHFVTALKQEGLAAELERIEPFYASVRRRAEGLDNSAARRKVLEELYDGFFKNALPKEAQRLGVVYTPHELVDFILYSVNDVLRQEFGKSISDKGVHILDPFAGMGTFIWRLLANPELIRDEDLERKYGEELHANELLPLAYYMATVNIEEAYRERVANAAYRPFTGMVWRDTFNAMTRAEGSQSAMQFMQENDARAKRQDETPISVIIGNPPYSTQQRNANDANPNVRYSHLEQRIKEKQGLRVKVRARNSLFDHYKIAIRWATDRTVEDAGIVAFVTNASFLDSNTDTGLRACLTEEFTSIYTFNLRGNARTSGEQRRKEKDNVFGHGSRAPVALTLLVNNPKARQDECRIYYKDIGDYLTREQKLAIVKNTESVLGINDWKSIEPDENHDWINLGDSNYRDHRMIGNLSAKNDKIRDAIFKRYCNGTGSGRDDWVYEFSEIELTSRLAEMTKFYNDAVAQFMQAKSNGHELLAEAIEKLTNPRPRFIKWDTYLINRLKRGRIASFNPNQIILASYRPYVKHILHFSRSFNKGLGQLPSFFPHPDAGNEVIYVQGIGGSKPFSALSTNAIPDLHLIEGGQAFPRETYKESTQEARSDTDDRYRFKTHTQMLRGRPALARARETNQPCHLRRRSRSAETVLGLHHRHRTRPRTRHERAVLSALVILGASTCTLRVRNGTAAMRCAAAAMPCLAAWKWNSTANDTSVTTIFSTKLGASISRTTTMIR